jgi:hypothetical protein
MVIEILLTFKRLIKDAKNKRDIMFVTGSNALDIYDWKDGLVWFMVFNATFTNISVISWRSVLLVETGVPEENHRYKLQSRKKQIWNPRLNNN